MFRTLHRAIQTYFLNRKLRRILALEEEIYAHPVLSHLYRIVQESPEELKLGTTWLDHPPSGLSFWISKGFEGMLHPVSYNFSPREGELLQFVVKALLNKKIPQAGLILSRH